MLFKRKEKKMTMAEYFNILIEKYGSDAVERNRNKQWSCLETVIRLELLENRIRELEDNMKVKLSNGVIVETDSIEVVKDDESQDTSSSTAEQKLDESSKEEYVNVSRETSALLDALKSESKDNAGLLVLLQDVQKEIKELKDMNAHLATTTTSGVTQENPEDVIYNMFKKEDK